MPVPKLTIEELSKSIKTKYPQYQNVPDRELVDKIVAKYPTYKDRIDVSAFSETNLDATGERNFSQWKSRLPKNLQNDIDYDLRGLFNENSSIRPSENIHFPDTYKKPNHITFSTESKYSNEQSKGGTWANENGKDVFYASDVNIKNAGGENHLKDYFEKNEPGVKLVLPKSNQKNAGAAQSIRDVYSQINQSDEDARKAAGLKGKSLPVDPHASYMSISASEGTRTVQPKQTEQKIITTENRLVREERIKKDTPIAIRNSAKQYFENNKIKVKDGSPALEQKVNELQQKLDEGDLVLFYDKMGNPKMGRDMSFFASLGQGFMDAISHEKQADELLNMSDKDAIKYLNDKNKESDEYLKPIPRQGSLGYTLGSGGPLMAKAITGAVAGAGLAAVAPETGGVSMAALPAFISFLFTAPALAKSGYTNSLEGRFFEGKQQGLTDEQSLAKAKTQALVGEATELATGALLSKLPVVNSSGAGVKNALTQVVKNEAKNVGILGATAAGGSLARSAAAKAAGYEDTSSQALSEAWDNGTEMMKVGAAMFMLTHPTVLPKFVHAQVKEFLSKAPPEQISASVAEAVEKGVISSEQGDRAIADMQSYNEARTKVPGGLSEEKSAAITGLLEKKANLEKQKATVDEAFHDDYNAQIKAIDGKIKEIKDSENPVIHEVDELTGESGSGVSVIKPEQNKAPNVVGSPEYVASKSKENVSVIKPHENAGPNVIETIKSNENAETIRGDEGQVQEGGTINEGGQNKGSEDIQQPTEPKSKLPKTEQQAGQVKSTITNDDFNGLKDKDGFIDHAIATPELTKGFNNGDKVEFFAEKKRTGTWDKERGLIVDEEGRPWGLTGILNEKEGYVKNLTLEGVPEELVTSIKNAKTLEERQNRGLKEVEVEAKRKFGDVFEKAKQSVDDGSVNARTLAKELSEKPRALNAEESATILYDRMQLHNEHKVVMSELESAIAKDEVTKAELLRRRLSEVEEEININDEASRKTGYEQGLGLAARKMMIKEDYSLANQLQRIRLENEGKEVPIEIRQKVEEYVKKLEEAERKLEEYEKQNATLKAQKELSKGSKNKKSNRTIEDYKKEREVIIKNIRDKWKNAGNDGTLTAVPLPYSKQLAAVAPEVGRLVKSYAEQGITELKIIVKDLHGELKKDLPDLTEDDVVNLLAGEYKGKKILSPDPAKMKLQADIAKIKDQIKSEREAIRLKNRSKSEKALDYFHQWRRFALLSGFKVLGKLGTAATARSLISPVESVVGEGLRRIPGIKNIAEDAPREGRFSPKAEAKALTQWVDKMTYQDMGNIIKGEKGQLDLLYGKDHEDGAGWLNFFGQLHAAIKVIPKRAEFFRSFELRAEQFAKEGKNLSDPMVQQEIAVGAYDDAMRAIFMNDNYITDSYKSIIKSLENTKNESLRDGAKFTANVLKFLLPIVKVPTNYVAEQTSYMVGGIKALYALRKGVSKLTASQKDYVLRALKKQSIGAAFIAIGYFNPTAIGGYYTGKRKEGDLEAGDLSLSGVHLPHWMTHTPLLEALQLGATLRRVQDSAKRTKEGGSFFTGIPAAAKGISGQVPFVSTVTQIGSALKGVEEFKKYAFRTGASVVEPQLIKEIAELEEKAVTGKVEKRDPATFLEQLEMGIPGMRENISEKNEKKTKRSRFRRT